MEWLEPVAGAISYYISVFGGHSLSLSLAHQMLSLLRVPFSTAQKFTKMEKGRSTTMQLAFFVPTFTASLHSSNSNTCLFSVEDDGGFSGWTMEYVPLMPKCIHANHGDYGECLMD